MKKKKKKQHVFSSETGLCIYCGADCQESGVLCDGASEPIADSQQQKMPQSDQKTEPETINRNLAIEVSVSKDRYDALPKIDLIASGYEFECPECLTYNTLIAIPKYGTAVECHYCHEQFQVEEVNHAQN